jgi:hypothetical protein
LLLLMPATTYISINLVVKLNNVTSLQLCRHTQETKMVFISSLVVLLLLFPADASATPAPAPAPAPARGPQPEEEICIGIGTQGPALACLGNVALSCLGLSAATEEVAFLACFLAGGVTEQCLAGPPKVEQHCIGIGISDDRMICLGLVGWSCKGSSFGYPGYIACFISSSVKCAVYN